ncbi:MAG: MaoC family dehydratase [Acidimicrobiaceae bacterium]|nr:MaoC family dehydratase [Acidimicrobiaceae bacterium]
MAQQIDGIAGLKAKIGEHIGYSDWHQITQEQINLFADATGDHQWIHVDPERAASGPFGTTIAHGYLTMSLIPMLLEQVLSVSGVSMAINYGANKLRFPSPVPSGSKVRLGATLAEVEEIQGGAQALVDITIETEGSTKPSLATQIVFRYYN